MAFVEFFDLIFGWLVKWSALGALVIITFLITFLVTLIYKYATKQEAMKRLKDEITELQKKIKEVKNDTAKMMEYNKEIMQKQMELFKHSLVPMVITLLPILLLFSWLRATYDPMGKIFMGIFGWLGTYIIFSILFNFTLRKLLKVY